MSEDFFSVCILSCRMKRASQLWDHLKLCTPTAGKYSFVIKIGVVPFTCFLELNNLWEAYVTKYTKVPVMNIQCSFYTLLLCSRWECASACHVTMCTCNGVCGSAQRISHSHRARVTPSLVCWHLPLSPVYKSFSISVQDWEKVMCYVTHMNIYAHKMVKGGILVAGDKKVIAYYS